MWLVVKEVGIVILNQKEVGPIVIANNAPKQTTTFFGLLPISISILEPAIGPHTNKAHVNFLNGAYAIIATGDHTIFFTKTHAIALNRVHTSAYNSNTYPISNIFYCCSKLHLVYYHHRIRT